VQVGGEGLSEGVVAAVDQALTQHELIKVGLGSGFEGDRKQAAADLAAATGSDLTQVIGRMVVLYRRRTEDLPDRPRIDLPDSARPPTE
jgi:RNA-binding protein